jgi:hypothetical protein
MEIPEAAVSSDELLDCRAAMLGLDLNSLENPVEILKTIKQRCSRCESAKTCELDLRRDPNDPIWETYCPNTTTLLALAKASDVS